MEPRFNEVTGDRPNLFVKWRVCYIENLDITNLRGKDQNARCIEAHSKWLISNTGDFCGHTIVPMSMTIISCCCLFTIRIKGFVDRWSVQCLPSVTYWHCNLLHRCRFYVWASGLCSLYQRICYIEVRLIEVLSHTFNCNFGWDVECYSLHQGLH